ncbi:hypothetical protein PUNSTDRAFT_131506 [Punctularia strigosozonata HHB-11173 SS5]|uniref:uncharacterized protein n=1 Tax=Punctularia strigosozonata (strain HHB-11173) TaxID=741275 RepID=UPI0004418412|nr:uncharacterized protein PUNSTDRAFT_131506 [Punctularia strigosozonata HHB-11173 SS5]EIN11342.1 hypothetical protein PUNSTDRAFT_131506 [Punctularia strigosozonata HHB-11173 SS5]
MAPHPQKKISASQPLVCSASEERAKLQARLYALEAANPTESVSASVARPKKNQWRERKGSSARGQAEWSCRGGSTTGLCGESGFAEHNVSNVEICSEVSTASSKVRIQVTYRTELSLPDPAPVKQAKHNEPALVVDEDNNPEVNMPCTQCKATKKECQPPIAQGKATACRNCARNKKLCLFANTTPRAPTASAAPHTLMTSAVVPCCQESWATHPRHNEDNLWSEVMEAQRALHQGEWSNDHSFLLDEIRRIVGGSEERVQDKLANLRRQVEALTSQVAEFVEGSSRQGRSESEEGEGEEEEEGEESEE